MALSIDDHMFQQASGSSPETMSSPEYSADFYNIDLDLLNNLFPSSGNGSSRESSPQHLLTPPQDPLLTSFPEVHDDDNTSNNFFSAFQGELKEINDYRTASAGLIDLQDPFSSPAGFVMGSAMNFEMSTMVVPEAAYSFNPQLSRTPSAVSDDGESNLVEQHSPPVVEKEEAESPILSPLVPIKVGGHGKARKGTVQSGGVTKAGPSTKPRYKVSKASSDDDEDHDEDEYDDIPQDLRPSPEAYAKMSSKEKRRLRNKISARNFRVRRKAYISTLEGDIEERDRMLDHFRTQLGSRECENTSLRQEIAALKNALLQGRGVPVDLPPPAPLPERSAAEALAMAENTATSAPAWPRALSSTWTGAALSAGMSSIPDISGIVRKGLQENINPALNAPATSSNTPASFGANKPTLNSFDGFADLNPFTMKTLDAYRMHLWGKMAAQQHMQHQGSSNLSHVQQPSGLAATMRPHFFNGAVKSNLPIASSSLSGKQSKSALLSYPTPPASPLAKDRDIQREKDQAMLAAVASQTIVRKLGSAFWEAFSGSSTATTASPSSSSSSTSFSSSSSSSPGHGAWDTDKVQKVLAGKAVLRVVDVEPTTATAKVRSPPMVLKVAPRLAAQQRLDDKKSSNVVCDILEESMRSLTLGKKM